MPTFQTFRGGRKVDELRGANESGLRGLIVRATGGGNKLLRRFDQSLGNTMQQWAVVSIVPDTSRDADLSEPLVRVLGLFETAEIAEAYIRNVAGNTIKDYDMYIVAMYQWLSPLDHARAKSVQYRDPEMQKIMDGVRSEQNRISLVEATTEETAATKPPAKTNGGDDE